MRARKKHAEGPTGSRERRPPWVRIGLLALCLAFLPACGPRKAYENASSLDTPDAYEAFLAKYPSHRKYTPLAKERRETLPFEQAAEADTYEKYLSFLRAYPLGKYSKLVELRAEDLRAQELGIHLYRTPPEDFFEWVDKEALPYRLRIRAWNAEPQDTAHIERKWYGEFARRELMVPMDPRKRYEVAPDLTLLVKESVIVLCAFPLAYVEAEMRAGEEVLKTYRIAAKRTEDYLLYEIFRDRDLYDARFRVTDEERKATDRRFRSARRRLPLSRSVALEYSLDQRSPDPDQELIRAFTTFLQEIPLVRDLDAYPRGDPPSRACDQRLYFSVDPEINAPRIRLHWSAAGPGVSWSEWNAKRILRDREYYFERMALDVLDLLESDVPPAYRHQRRN